MKVSNKMLKQLAMVILVLTLVYLILKKTNCLTSMKMESMYGMPSLRGGKDEVLYGESMMPSLRGGKDAVLYRESMMPSLRGGKDAVLYEDY